MMEQINKKIDHLESQVGQIYVALSGDIQMGIEGVIPLLHRHMRESKSNFADFRESVGMDYVQNFNRIDDSITALTKVVATDAGRIKVLETHKENSGNRFGFIVGISAGCGAFVASVAWLLAIWLK